MKKKIYKMIGGPLDGQQVPDSGYFAEGDIEAVDSRHVTGGNWSPESVYVVRGKTLVYDHDATLARRFLTAR